MAVVHEEPPAKSALKRMNTFPQDTLERLTLSSIKASERADELIDN